MRKKKERKKERKKEGKMTKSNFFGGLFLSSRVLKVAMSGENFKLLWDCCNESHREPLAERS